MNRTAISIVLAVSFLLVACGNKGELFLETDQATTDEIKQLDDSLDELGSELGAPSSNVSEADVDSVTQPLGDAATDAEAEAAIKKAKKKTDEPLQAAD